MAKGKIRPDSNGVFVVDKTEVKHDKPEVKVQVISPTQQSVDQAKAIVKEQKSIRGRPPGRKTLW
jgi:hypothetical protein